MSLDTAEVVLQAFFFKIGDVKIVAWFREAEI